MASFLVSDPASTANLQTLAKTAPMDFGRYLLPAHLNRQACWVRHHWADHPLFDTERLLQPVKFLPETYRALRIVYGVESRAGSHLDEHAHY